MKITTAQTSTLSPTKSAARPGPWLQFGPLGDFAIRECPLEIPGLPAELEGFRILHISDLHLTKRWHDGYHTAIQTIAELDLDVILCTGDIVEDKRTHIPAMPQVTRLLPALKSRLGLYTILGNHDNYNLGLRLREMGINVLDGERQEIAGAPLPIELIAAPGHRREHLFDGFASRFAPPSPSVPRIVMAHFPDHYPKLEMLSPDVYLCGHTHGGQICLPGGWPILKHDSSPRPLCRGQHRRGKTHYIVNHGFGCSMWNIRLFCPPEIILITLHRGA